MNLNKIIVSIFILASFGLSGQTLSSQVSDNTLVLGEVGEFKINIVDLHGAPTIAPQKNELLPFAFETLSDSISSNENEYNRVLRFQIFEEGKYKLPPIEFKVGQKVLKTVPYEITVINPAKQGDEISDIKNNKDITLLLRDYWNLYKKYILGALGIVILGILLYYVIKASRKRKTPERSTTHRALKELEALRKKNYIATENYRSFYVELIDIIRAFLTERYGFPARELLSDDLLDYMKKQNVLSSDDLGNLSEIFYRGDLTKFAKAIPNKDDMESDFKKVKSFVKRAYQVTEAENRERND